MESRKVSDDERAKELQLSDERKHEYKTNAAIVKARGDVAQVPDYAGKIDAIKDKEAEESLPIIINILLHIQEVLVAELAVLQTQNPASAEKYKETSVILEKIITIFGETDKVTQGDDDAKLAYVKKLKEAAEKKAKETGGEVKVFGDLELLVAEAGKLELTTNTAPIWNELATWLEGLYWHNAHNIRDQIDPATNEPKKSNKGVISPWNKKLYYPRVDGLDSLIFKWYDITKLDVSIHYHRASLLLQTKYDAFVPDVKPAEVLATGQSDAPSAIRNNMELLPSDRKDYTARFIKIKEEDIPADVSIKAIVRSMFSNPLGVMLSSKAHLQTDSRIKDFEKQLGIYKLSPDLTALLGGFKAAAEAVLDSYTNPTKLHIANPARHLPQFLPGLGFFKKTNTSHATTTKALLQEAKNDVLKQFQIMLDLRKTLGDAESTTLLPAVNKLLMNQIDIIRRCPNANASRIDYHFDPMPADYSGDVTYKIDIPDKDVTMGDIICKAIQGFFSNPLGLALAPMIDCDDDARIQHFERMLKDHGLTPLQKVEFSNFRANASAELDRYTNPANLSIINPVRYVGRNVLPFGSYLENVHAPLADETKGKMMTNPTVAEQIKAMIDLRTKLQGEGSQTLYPEITKFLIDFINSIIPQHAYCAKRNETLESQPRKLSGIY